MAKALKKKPNHKLKSKVNKWIWDAQYHLGVRHYSIGVRWMDEDEEIEEGRNTMAKIRVDRRYLTATIDIFPALIEKENVDKGIIKKSVYHEVSHIVTQHLYDVGTATYKDSGEMHDAWESCTESVSRLALLIDELRK